MTGASRLKGVYGPLAHVAGMDATPIAPRIAARRMDQLPSRYRRLSNKSGG